MKTFCLNRPSLGVNVTFDVRILVIWSICPERPQGEAHTKLCDHLIMKLIGCEMIKINKLTRSKPMVYVRFLVPGVLQSK